MSNQVNWIALPGGRHDLGAERTRLTLFASLRIEEPPECPEIFDWPATVAALRFRVVFDDGDPAGFPEEGGVLHRASADPDPEAWVRAFGHVIERPARLSALLARRDAEILGQPSRMLTFDARTVATEVDRVYRSSIRDQAATIASGGTPVGTMMAFDSGKTATAVLSRFAERAQISAFQQFYRPVPVGSLQADNEPFDFSQTLAILSQYPFLLRLFGIAIDFELDLPPSQFPAAGRVRIEALNPIECPSASAWTAFQAPRRGDSVVFTARPRDATAYRDGFLQLGANSRYVAIQQDIEGQTMKLDAMRSHLERGAASDIVGSGTALPAQRTVGLTFLHSGRVSQLAATTEAAVRFVADAEHAAANGGVTSTTLFLEDVCRSVRPDVKRDDRKFLGLCSREVDFTIGQLPAATTVEGVMDEGLIAGTLTQPDADVRVHEGLFRFDGFGLCVDRPFATADHEEDGDADAMQLRVEAVPRAVPGSLPALRFGSDYQFAVRLADIAGGGLTLDDTRRLLDDGPVAVADAVSAHIRFVRREPIGSPLLVPTAELGPGEASDVVAVRTNHRGHTRSSKRHLLPPAVAVEVAERSGVFDGLDPDDIFDLVKDRDEPLADETYPESRFAEVPYLADPIARHARLEFVGLPQHPQPFELIVPFQKRGWRKASGILIELRGGHALPKANDSTRPVVTIELPPGRSATLFIQSLPDPEDLQTTFLAEYGFADDPRFVAHPALAPVREVRLAHAVEQPLTIPAFTDPTPLPRQPAETAVQIDDQVAVDIDSTGRLTCLARWDEPVDAPPLNREAEQTRPGRVSRSAEAFSFPLAASLEHVLLAEGGVDRNGDIIPNRHQLGTTGHRSVEYELIAETRYSVFFPDAELASTRRNSEPAVVEVPNASRPPTLSVRHIVPLFDWRGDEHGLGEDAWYTSTEPVVERQRLSRRLRVYVERPCLLSGFNEQLGVVLWPAPLADVGDDEAQCLRKVVTQWALDPIWQTSPLPDGPFARHFPLAETVLHGIELEEIPTLGHEAVPGAERECSLQPDELVNRVVVAGHALHFDEESDAWFADVEIDCGESYFPFVRLALVRFQPVSLPGAHVSRMTFADFVQLAPDRFLTLSYSPTPRPLIVVSLVGPGYEPQAGDWPDAIVDVQLEAPGYRRSDLGWVPVGDAVVLDRTKLPDGRMAWSGELWVPADAPGDLRLTIREFERFRDPGSGLVRRRLVYSDMVAVGGDRRWYD